MKQSIIVTITDAQTLTRIAIKHYLNSINDIRVVLDTSCGNELLEQLNRIAVTPHICLLEVGLPDINGLQTLKKIKKDINPDIKVVILSAYQSPVIITKFLRNGASGFIPKNENPESFVEAIRHVYNGCIYYPDTLLRKALWAGGKNVLYHTQLTSREFEFLALCGTELSYKQMAEKMHLSRRTIESYRNNLFRKLDIKTRVGLAIYAITTGVQLFDEPIQA